MLIHPELKKIHETTIEADPYYIEKYNYLKKCGFFSEFKPNNFETTISESKVKESIIQTPQILFEVTDTCNLRCTYCALGELYEWGKDRNSKNIDIDSAFNLLKYIFELKLLNKQYELVISFYGGEPLLNINAIKQIVEFSQSLNFEQKINIGYSMTTNAILIDKHIDYLISNMFNLLVSLDGNEENNSYRLSRREISSSFQKVINNMDMIQKKNPEYFENNINFNTVLHNRNSVKSTCEYIYNKYHKIPQISELNNIEIDPTQNGIFKSMFNSVIESESEYRKEEGHLLPHNELSSFHELSVFLKYLTVNSYVSNVASLLYKEDKYFPASTCLPFSKKIFLTVNNTLLPCERINYKHILGEINGNVMIDTKKIAQQYSSYYEQMKKKCQHCYLYRFCGLCLFHVRNINSQDNKEYICDSFHDKNAFQTKLYRIFSFLEKYPNDFFDILENEVIIS